MSSNNRVEIGTAIAEALAATIEATLDDYDLPQPAVLSPFTGAGTPIIDPCDGLVWVRVGTVYPTDGTTAPFGAARVSWEVPAWCFPLEVGVLWCHQNLTEQGEFIDPDKEAEYAARDGQYRLALLDAIGYRWRPQPPDPLAAAVMGQRLDPWMPVGPDGGYSGGTVVVYVVAGGLAICPE